MTPASEKWPAQAEMLQNRIKKNQRRLKNWLRKEGVTCYRLYHLDIPEIPLLIDWYEGNLHVGVKIKGAAAHDDTENEWIRFLVNETAKMLNVNTNNVFIKYRIQGKGGTQYTAVSSDARIFHVREGGHKFVVNLSDYLDTGLFLDHRITRQRVAAEAAGKRFLNLFAYTGSFTVYAAAGGAVSTTTVDLSNTYLEAARVNMELNGFTGGSHRYQKNDILKLLSTRAIREMYDLVVMDAPTISKSKSMKQNLIIQNDYIWMLNALLACVSRDGVIYFSCNHSRFTFHPDKVAAAHVEDLTHQTTPPDFAGKSPHKCFRLIK